MQRLKETLASKIPGVRREVLALINDHGGEVLSEVTIAQAYGGIQGVRCLVAETSGVDPMQGIRFRGYTIPQLQIKLPSAPGGAQPLPEGMFHLLVSGDLPTSDDVQQLGAEWAARGTLPEYVYATVDALPRDTHPVAQFAAGILSMQSESEACRRSREGLSRRDLWDPTFDDAMTVLSRLPALAAYVYRRTFHGGERIAPDPQLDWAANFGHMMGIDTPGFFEALRLYLVLFCDHEAGAISAHATRLIGSVPADAYFALSAGMHGLARPLLGRPSGLMFLWVQKMMNELGGVPSREALSRYCMEMLEREDQIPAYGHAVLRRTDPRYVALRGFYKRHFPQSDLFRTVDLLYQVAPKLLMAHRRSRSPWPSAEALSGVLLADFGVVEHLFFGVVHGVSRALGVLASLCWDRALMLPAERPKSVTTSELTKKIERLEMRRAQDQGAPEQEG